METRTGEGVREKSRRPIRNKRYNRRTYGEDKRPPKRLFTPEIKRYLKDWLIRRRDNPYPNRDEKKMLAVQTGLTYIQVCNWFANWRRKLKNAGKEPQKKTWGDLIKTYNNQVQGNVEHFSIGSDDSIWEEPEDSTSNTDMDHTYGPIFCKTNPKSLVQNFKRNRINFNNNSNDLQNQCYFVSSTTEGETENPFSQTNSKYKSQIMEKYLRDCDKPAPEDDCKTSMISKWLESAANFKPSEESYLDWTLCNDKDKKKRNKKVDNDMILVHGREELDAAEALTTLANCSRSYKK